jgi:hypothetical protein
MKNKNLKLELNADTVRAMLPMLRKSLPSVVGLALVGVFGYTAYELNAAINVQPSASQSTLTPLPAVSFSQKVISSLQNRDSVNGTVPVDLGTNNPY